MKETTRINVLVIFLSIILTLFFLPQMPDNIASHWDINGAVNGYMSKPMGLAIFPVLIIIVTALLAIFSKIDPEKTNIRKFSKSFDWFIVILNVFFFYLYALVIIWNLGVSFNMTLYIVPAFAVLMYSMGSLIGSARRNYTIGIKTPWTLADEKVWDKTHKLGEKLFKIDALIILLGMLVPAYTFWIFIFSILIISIYLTIYSYIEFNKTKNK